MDIPFGFENNPFRGCQFLSMARRKDAAIAGYCKALQQRQLQKMMRYKWGILERERYIMALVFSACWLLSSNPVT